MKRPIVTFTTDFGLSDAYVAEMKAAVIAENPHCTLIDVTHLIPPQNVLAGSIALERVITSFPPRTIHVGVVDPGVGGRRRIIIAKIESQRVICPDNGLITWAWRMHKNAKAYELNWQPKRSSNTFHGRDIMGPVAGMLSRGKSIKSVAQRIDAPILLDMKPAASKRGEVIYIDHFGSAITNFVGSHGSSSVRAGRKSIGIHRTYSGVPKGEPVALVGSSGLLEIAVRNGNAAKRLGLRVGHEVILA